METSKDLQQFAAMAFTSLPKTNERIIINLADLLRPLKRLSDDTPKNLRAVIGYLREVFDSNEKYKPYNNIIMEFQKYKPSFGLTQDQEQTKCREQAIGILTKYSKKEELSEAVYDKIRQWQSKHKPKAKALFMPIHAAENAGLIKSITSYEDYKYMFYTDKPGNANMKKRAFEEHYDAGSYGKWGSLQDDYDTCLYEMKELAKKTTRNAS